MSGDRRVVSSCMFIGMQEGSGHLIRVYVCNWCSVYHIWYIQDSVHGMRNLALSNVMWGLLCT